jgi:hypothetical protein
MCALLILFLIFLLSQQFPLTKLEPIQVLSHFFYKKDHPAPCYYHIGVELYYTSKDYLNKLEYTIEHYKTQLDL